ncbi:MAG TPA: helical backbone metal receptor, partial [Quisquiliibacterium sp.]|nr:helical backbone metal receptor [Quisquiliibacterium sp.]
RLAAVCLSIAVAALAAGEARAQGALRLVDDWQRVIELPQAPRRIVSLAPHATELLFAAGAGARVVAVDRSSDHPAEVRRLPSIAAHPRPDPERLLAVSPDLVVVWGAAADRELVARLRGFGLPVFVSEPRSLEDVAATLERFAALGDAPGRARDEARRLREAVASLRARHAQRSPVPVFVQVWSRPLITLSDRDTFADVLRTCGARNVFGAERMPAPQVGAEEVIRRAPRLILAFGGAGQDGREPWARLGMLSPEGPVGFARIDPAIQRPTPRVLEPMARLCEAIDAVRG